MQAFAQIGVSDLLHAGAGGGLFFFNGSLSRKAATDVLLHAAHPAFGVGKHAVGFEHIELLFAAATRACEHFIDPDAQFFNGLAEAFKFAMRVFGDGIGYNNARLV